MGVPGAGARSRADAWLRGLDLSDATLTRRARARLMAGFALLVALLNATLPFVGLPGVPARPQALPLVLVQLAVAGVALWRGDRLGDRQYVAASVVALAAGTPLIMLSTTRGSLRTAELTLLVPLVMGAVFATTRAQAATVVAASIAGSAAVSIYRIPDVTEGRAQAFGQLVCLGLLGVVVRWLQESALAAVSAARLGEVTDPLTGVLNRRGFERDGVAAWERARVAGTPLTVVLLDLDHFKDVNDVQGHAVGDAVLRRVGTALRAGTRAGDVAVRLGGEEFAVLCRTEPGAAPAVGERLHAALDLAIAPITVSVGVVEVAAPGAGPDATEALWRAVAAADAAMYQAKRTGRDRVVVGSL